MWWIIALIIVSLLLFGFAVENANLRGKLESRDYEKKILENRLKFHEGDK